jgi:hypothetical protein
MRAFFFILLMAAAVGCGDDDADTIDGGDDGAVDAGARDAGDAAGRDAGDAGDGAVCDLEFTQPWLSYGPAKRASLDELCGKDSCPANWEAALARARAAGVGDLNDGCYEARTLCGVDRLSLNWGTHGWIWVFDHETGELIGAANQFTDSLSPGACSFIEVVAGTDEPASKPQGPCPAPAPPTYYGFCWHEEDAGMEDGGR